MLQIYGHHFYVFKEDRILKMSWVDKTGDVFKKT